MKADTKGIFKILGFKVFRPFLKFAFNCSVLYINANQRSQGRLSQFKEQKIGAGISVPECYEFDRFLRLSSDNELAAAWAMGAVSSF